MPKSDVLQGTLDLMVMKTLESLGQPARLRHRAAAAAGLRRPADS